jgi:hypothetical protein
VVTIGASHDTALAEILLMEFEDFDNSHRPHQVSRSIGVDGVPPPSVSAGGTIAIDAGGSVGRVGDGRSRFAGRPSRCRRR